MRRATTLISLLILAPILLYAGFKGYLWYSIKSDTEDFQKLTAPFANLNYREIDVAWTSLSGPIGLRGITITPTVIDDEIRIESILLHPKNFTDLYEVVKSLTSERLPSRLRLSLDGIVLNLDGEIAGWLNAEQKGSWLGNLDAVGCGRTHFDADALRTMGYEQLANDIVFQYQQDRRGNTFEIIVKVRTHDMMSAHVEASLPLQDVPLNEPLAISGLPTLAALAITVEDLGYNENRNKFCAINLGIEVKEFVDRHVAGVKALAGTEGLDLSDELVSAYKSFVAESGEVAISFNPIDPMSLGYFSNVGAIELADQLGMSISYNNNDIKTLFNPRPVEVMAGAEDEKPKVAPDTYKPTPVKELPVHINRLIKVHTADGKLHHAYLESISSENLVLTRHLTGGSATFIVPIAEIQDVLVLY